MAGTAALVLAGIGTATAVDSAQDAKKDRKELQAKTANAEAERKAAEAKGIQDAYASTQMRKQALRSNSLFTGGAGGTEGAGRQTLGV